MNKKVVIRLALDESPEVRAVSVRTGWCVVVSVDKDGNKFDISDPCQGNIFANHISELAAKDRRISELEEELAKFKDSKAYAEGQRNLCMGKLREMNDLSAQFRAFFEDEETRQLLGEPSEKAAVEHFDERCRQQLIVRDLKAFIKNHRPGGYYASEPWRLHYWPIVHQLFVELRWWKQGTIEQFVRWVNSLNIGAELKVSNYKAGRSRIKDRVKGWYARPAAAGDDFGRMGHALYMHFVGGLHLDGLVKFEKDHIDHSDLRRNVALAAGTTHMQHRARVLALMEPAGHAVPLPDVRPAWFAVPFPRHVYMGTFGIIDNTKPGRRRRVHTAPGLRKRRGLGQLAVHHHLW